MKTFLLLCDFGEIISMLTDREAGMLFKAVFNYELNSVMPEFSNRTLQVIFFDMKRFLDSNRENYERVCRQRSEYAKKRWEKIREKADESANIQKDAQVCLSMHKHTAVGNTDVNDNAGVNADYKVNDNADVNVCVNTNANADINTDNEQPKLQEEVTQTYKKAYGEFKNVYLTDNEYSLVKNKLSEGERRLESLSAYMKATGKTYSDHYAMLINWNFYGNDKTYGVNTAQATVQRVKQPGERREPTFDVSEFTKKALNLKYVPPAEDD